ncbi:glycosyl transferase family 2, partial [Halobacteriales archaeon QH_10_70_21]
MYLSVVVPTLNDRDRLESCLDALSADAPDEGIVVNGPSTDGTSGM